MIKAVASPGGNHIAETLPSGQLLNVQWIPRNVAVNFEEYEPSTLTIAAPGIDVVTCPEFKVQLVKDDHETLVTVYCQSIENALLLVRSKSHTATMLRRGFRVHGVWEAMNFNSLGCEVIAILSDHSFRAIGVIASEMALEMTAVDLQAELDLMVANGDVRRHFIGDCWFYQLMV